MGKNLEVLAVPFGNIIANGEIYGNDKKFIPFARELPVKQRGMLKAKTKKFRGNVLSLVHERRNYSYYHWMFETLPKLACLNRIEPIDYFYLQYGLKHQEKCFKILGIDERKVINANKYPAISADKIFVPPAVSESYIPSAWAIHWLRKSLLKEESSCSRKIYVGRGGLRA